MKRYEFIDVAKGIGILLVVWAHILIVGPSHKFAYAFHMPLFFFLSAMLFKKEKNTNITELVRRRTKRLLIPYFVYSIISWCLWAGFRYLRGDEVGSYIGPLLQTFFAQGSGAFLVHNSALWFIPCLFVLEILFFFLSKLTIRYMLLTSFTLAFVGCLMAHIYGDKYLMTLPWNFDAAIFALPFFGLAYTIREKIGLETLQEYIKNHIAFSSVCVFAILSLMSILTFSYGECSMGSSSYLCPMWVFYFRAFMGCFAVVILSIIICSVKIMSFFRKVFMWLGINSLDIMCTHIPIKGFVILVIAKLLHNSIEVSHDEILSLIAFMATMIIIVPLAEVINKYVRKTDIKYF